MGNVWRWRQSATTPSTKLGGAYGQPQQPRASIGQRATRADAAKKEKKDGYERWERKDVCEELSVYTLWNVVNKCITRIRKHRRAAAKPAACAQHP